MSLKTLVLGLALTLTPNAFAGTFSAHVLGSATTAGLGNGRFALRGAEISIREDGQEIMRFKLAIQGTTRGNNWGTSAHFVSGDLTGVNELTTLGDLTGKYAGRSAGYTWTVPGPCCLSGGDRNIQLRKVGSADLAMSLKSSGGIGLDTDSSTIDSELTIQWPAHASDITAATTLAQLAERRKQFTFDVNMRGLIKCQNADLNAEVEFRADSMAAIAGNVSPRGFWANFGVMPKHNLVKTTIEGQNVKLEFKDYSDKDHKIEFEMAAQSSEVAMPNGAPYYTKQSMINVQIDGNSVNCNAYTNEELLKSIANAKSAASLFGLDPK